MNAISSLLILTLISGAVGRGQTFTDDFSKPLTPWVSRPGKALTKGSGFFRTLQADGRWWLVDPEGKPFFDIGTDHVSYGGHWCEALGYAPYHRNVAAKYGSEPAWGRATLQRLESWGFNCLPAGHSPSLRHQGLAHIEFASFGAEFARREWITRPVNWTGFPDVFSPRWESHCRNLARNLARQTRGDPWCIGTFLDNELEWYGKNRQLVDEVFQLGAGQPAKQALYQWLLQRFGSLVEVNRRLGTGYADEAAFLSTTNVPSPTPALELIREGFMAEVAERYFSVASRALREADPDHLVLGCRFARQAPKAALAAAGKYNDVFTINIYPRVDFENAWLPDGTGGSVERVPQQLSEYYALALKPEPRSQVELKGVDTTWVCSGKTGALFDRIESGGLVLGRLVFAVHQRIKGQDQWVESSRIRRLAMQTEPQAWVVEAEVEYPGASEGPAGYRARVRAVVFRELGLAFVRPLWVESLDARDWQLVEVFWFCRSAIGGSPEDDVVGGPGVPNYYRAAQFITDTKLGGCFGSLHQPDGWQVMFWTNPQGGIHPDSRLAVDQPMTPNRRWQPAAMPYLWVYGASRADAWKEFSKLSQQAGQALGLFQPR